MTPRYSSTRLRNGLVIVAGDMPHMSSVSVGLWIAVGSRCEPRPLNGICHFIEHMVFKGTEDRTAREISQAIEGVGGYLNAFTSEENTCFYARARPEHLDLLLDVLFDMVRRPRFAPGDVARERAVIEEEVAGYFDQPAQYVQELLNAALWPRHPLGRPITGTLRTLPQIRRPQLRQFLHQHYGAATTVLAAAGRLDHAALVRAVQRHARGYRPGTLPVSPPVRGGQRRAVIRTAIRDTEQTQLALGLRTCSRHDPRRFALRLFNALLGENMSSRLFQVIRESQGLAYHIGSAVSCFEDTGDLVISAGLDPGNVSQVLKLIQGELRRFRTRRAGRTEFLRARESVIGQMELSLENTENHMNWLGEQWLGYQRLEPPRRLKDRLAAVTPTDVRDVARDFLRSDRANLAIVSPRRPSPDLVRLLTLD